MSDKVIKSRYFNSWRGKDGGWFRLFGYGLTWKHERAGLMFSERNGYTKYCKIGKWIIKTVPHG